MAVSGVAAGVSEEEKIYKFRVDAIVLLNFTYIYVAIPQTRKMVVLYHITLQNDGYVRASREKNKYI